MKRSTDLSTLNDDQLYGYLLCMSEPHGRISSAKFPRELKHLYENGYISKEGAVYVFMIQKPAETQYQMPENFTAYFNEFIANAKIYGKGTKAFEKLVSVIEFRTGLGTLCPEDLCRFVAILVAVREGNYTINPSYSPIASEKHTAGSILGMGKHPTVIGKAVNYFLYDKKHPNSVMNFYYDFNKVEYAE